MARNLTTGKQVAQWARKKYGADALYMLKETGEGREVHGDKVTTSAVKLLERRAKRQKMLRAQRKKAKKDKKK